MATELVTDYWLNYSKEEPLGEEETWVIFSSGIFEVEVYALSLLWY